MKYEYTLILLNKICKYLMKHFQLHVQMILLS